MFNSLFYQPILTALLWFNQLTGNLGLAIITLTLVIRTVLIPLTLPSIKAAAKMRDLKPELDDIRRKYKDDKTKQQQAQLDLFRQHQVNPAAGCLPQIVQFIVLIALYQVFIDLLKNGHQQLTNLSFLWLNLAQPDKSYILPVVTGVAQLLLGVMILPGSSTGAEKTLAAATPTKKDDDSADNMTQMANTMQQQMIFVMPIMTAILAVKFPSGLALYWVVSTLFSLIQQWVISGPGGLAFYYQKALNILNRKIM